MKKNILLFTIVLISLAIQVSGQTGFLATYPTTYDKDAREVLVMPDKGYLIAGSTNNSNVSDADLYVMKTDSMGNFLWGKTYGGAKPEYAFSMIATSDGNYFVTGYSQSFGSGDYDIYLIKIDPSGNLLWQKTYGGTGNEHAREIIHTSDGNYMLTGPSNSGQSSQQAYLMKIDLAGTVLWTKYYGGSSQETSNSVKETPDGGFIMSGQTFSYGQSNGVVYLIKTDVNGDTTWTKYYNTGSLLSEAISLVSNGDGSFAFVVRDSTAASDIDVRIMKMNSTGGVVWNKDYGGSQKDTPKRLRNTNDGGYVAATTSRSFGWINPDMWILKFDANGDTLWSRHFGGSNHEHGNDIKQMPDGGYIVVGHSKSYGPDGQRIMLVRINSAGVLGIKVNDEELSFNLFPNPSTDGALAIRYSRAAISSVKICNSLGQCVYSGTLEFETNEAKTITLLNTPPGVYVVSLQIENRVATRKIIIE